MGLKLKTTAAASALALFLAVLFHNAHAQRRRTTQKGICRWSGTAPGCGNGVCPGTDDWYAIGNSTIDEDGNECADGINSLHCCPKVRKPRPFRVRLCTGTDLQGDCVDIEKSDTECVELPAKVKYKANSVDTYGGCVRLYNGDRPYRYQCIGTSVALHRGNSEKHTALSKFNFEDQAESIGPCLRDDFCAPKDACRFPVEEFTVGCCPRNTVVSENTSGGPVRYYQLGYKNRTEYVFAVLEPIHLNTGPQPTSESLQHVRSLGLDTDVVGMLVPARLGGNGTDPRNLFPLTSDPNIQAVLKTYEDIIYELVREYGQVRLLYVHAHAHYPTPTDTRPTQVVLGVLNTNTKASILLFQDSIGNPVFPISVGIRTVSVVVSPAAARATLRLPTTSTTQTTARPFQTTASTAYYEPSEQPDHSTAHWLYYVIPSVIVVTLGVLLMGLCPIMLRKLRGRNGNGSNNTGQSSSPLLEQEPPISVHFDMSTIRLG